MLWTEAQRAVLEDPSRIRVVRACPGSGKTQVFIEALRRLLEAQRGKTGAVAALSFTNAAKQEITQRLDAAMSPPHFVGTLDAFMLRFVVRPFGHLVGLSTRGARLIPGDLTHYHSTPVIYFGSTGADKVSAFEVYASGGAIAAPEFTFRALLKGVVPLPRQYAARALDIKRQEWERNGRVTHSDCQYIAAAVLTHPTHGQNIIARIARRFPAILVDEFQDTGHFLGQALLALLASSDIKGLVVGDPDQAIYEFGGANPLLFETAEQLNGAVRLALPETHRCPGKVAAVATSLSVSQASIQSVGLRGEGRALLLRHQLVKVVPDQTLISAISDLLGEGVELAVLARKTATVAALTEHAIGRAPDGCAIARKLDKAAVHLRQGHILVAAKQAAAVLGDLALEIPNPTRAQLLEHGICPKVWRRAQYNLISEATRQVDGESWGDWLDRMKGATGNALRSVGKATRVAELGPKFRKRGPHWVDARDQQSPGELEGEPAWPIGTTVRTVHAVKGAEFDAVVLFVPKPHAGHTPCPSGEWWGSRPEERRIAFVAASRAKRDFVLCVHETSYKALVETQPAFVGLFEVVPASPLRQV